MINDMGFRGRRWMPRPKKLLTLLTAVLFTVFVVFGVCKLAGVKIDTFHGQQPYNNMKAAALENYKRLQTVEAVCRKYELGFYKGSKSNAIPHPPVPQYSVFYFARDQKLAICPIYKAGSSTWLTNLIELSGMTDSEIKNSGQQLSAIARRFYPELEAAMAADLLKSSWTILTVRHPFERLLSAYRDKLENINTGREHGTLHFYKAYGSKIVKRYRPGGNKTKTSELLSIDNVLTNPDQPKSEGIEPTFEEFVRYLIGSNLAAASDDHWIPYYLFCTPCLVKYDFLAHVESLDRDQQYIFETVGLSDELKPKWAHKTQFYQSGGISKVAQHYFRQLTTSQIEELYEKYRIDFELFGYDYKPYLKFSKNSLII